VGITTVFNIVANLFFISYGAEIGGGVGAMVGAAIATVLSRLILTGILVWDVQKEFNFKFKDLFIFFLPFLNAAVMTFILLLVLRLFELAGYWKLVLVPLGALVYLISSLLTKSITLNEIRKILRSF
jgi:peptidoglycan biosynthesis protein MviN/MurJ (putative lipid II flippase)